VTLRSRLAFGEKGRKSKEIRIARGGGALRYILYVEDASLASLSCVFLSVSLFTIPYLSCALSRDISAKRQKIQKGREEDRKEEERARRRRIWTEH